MQLTPFVLSTLACASCATVAVAQTAPAATGERQLHAKVGVNTIYDNNFSRSSGAVAQQRGLENNEVTVRPTVSVDVMQPLGRQAVFLQGSAGYDFHRENKQLDRGRADVQGGYITSLGMCSGSALGSFRTSQSDLETLDVVSGPAVKNRSEVTSVSLGVQCGRAQGFNGGFSVQRLESQNTAPIQRVADNTVESLSVQVGYANPTLGALGLMYNYANNEVPNRIIPGRPIGDGFSTQTFGITASRNFGSRIRVSGSAGQTTVKREFAPIGVSQKFTSTTYSGAASYQMGSRLNFELTGGRAVSPSIRAGKLYDISTNGQINATYKLGSRYVFSGGYRITDTKSNADTALAALVVTKSRLNSTFASIRYNQSRRVSLALDVRYDERDTNLPDFNYTATRVGLTAEVGF